MRDWWGNYGQLADELAAAAEIATAASKLTELRGMEGLKCHEDLLDAASALTSAISTWSSTPEVSRSHCS